MAMLADLATVSEALELVKVQFTLVFGATALAFKFNMPAARFVVVVPPGAKPEQLMEESAKPVGTVSVTEVAVELAVNVFVGAATLVPAVVVVMDCAPMPLPPLKLKAPTAPFEILLSVIVAG